MIEREEYLFGIEEKYLAATELVDCREFPAAKVVLHEILEQEPGYARAHFELARIYAYGLYDLAKAYASIKLCYELDRNFTPVYYVYLDILLKKRAFEEASSIIEKAWEVEGICRSCIANHAASIEEAQQNYDKAQSWYRNSFLYALNNCCSEDFEKNIERIKRKQQLKQRFVYNR